MEPKTVYPKDTIVKRKVDGKRFRILGVNDERSYVMEPVAKEDQGVGHWGVPVDDPQPAFDVIEGA